MFWARVEHHSVEDPEAYFDKRAKILQPFFSKKKFKIIFGVF